MDQELHLPHRCKERESSRVLVVGSTDMHEKKNIDTVIQSIYRLRETGQVELFRVVVQFISVVFRMHWFRVDQDWRATGSQDQR